MQDAEIKIARRTRSKDIEEIVLWFLRNHASAPLSIASAAMKKGSLGSRRNDDCDHHILPDVFRRMAFVTTIRNRESRV
jgi:hypothetical protein